MLQIRVTILIVCSTILSLKIKEGVFTEVVYAGKFLAAAVAKRPVWLERVKIKDIYGKNNES